MRFLMWFRSDLRISDNTALSRAAAAGEVVGLFVVSPGEWSSHDLAPVRVDLMLRTVSELAEGLGKLNIPLLVVRAETGRDVPRLVLEVARRSGCDGLFFNREYEIDEAKRDEATTELFGRAGLKTEGCTDQVVLAPGDVRTGEGRAFTVFTPFKRAWIRVLQERGAGACAAAPRKQGVVAMDVPQPWRVVSDCIEGFDSAIDAKLWPAGEGEARRRLNRLGFGGRSHVHRGHRVRLGDGEGRWVRINHRLDWRWVRVGIDRHQFFGGLGLLAFATLHEQDEQHGDVHAEGAQDFYFETGKGSILLRQIGALRNQWTRTIHVVGAYRVLSLRFGLIFVAPGFFLKKARCKFPTVFPRGLRTRPDRRAICRVCWGGPAPHPY